MASTAQDMTARLAPAAKLAVPASVPLGTSGTTFQAFTGALTLSYRARSSPGGGGTVTMQVTSDFSPAGGPAVSSGALVYTCDPATLGTSCPGPQTASTSLQTPILTIPPSVCTGGGGACSTSDPNQVQIRFRMENQPGYQTGSYSALITLVISST
jgi:hypothetical protein